jgi:hypothetical protein
MRHLHSFLSVSSLVVAALAMADAQADNVGRFLQANATSHCQTALPVFDGNVRKRPLAVQNEGDGDVFVTCSFTGQATTLAQVHVFLSNADTSQQIPVSCTAVTGHRRQANEYVTKATVVQGYLGQLVWGNEDFEGTPSGIPGSGLFSVTCKLPPGIGIGNATVLLFEDVGN